MIGDFVDEPIGGLRIFEIMKVDIGAAGIVATLSVSKLCPGLSG